MSIGEKLSFRSPDRKLLPFLLRSRDGWKAKCLDAKTENKSLKYRLGVMTKSRDRWKAEVRELKKRLADIEKHLAAEKATVEKVLAKEQPAEEQSPKPSKNKRAQGSSTARR